MLIFELQLIKLDKDKREKHEFKRSRILEKKLLDPEKTPTPVVGFTPFAATQPPPEEREEREREDKVSLGYL